jgi:hypothetical protein
MEHLAHSILAALATFAEAQTQAGFVPISDGFSQLISGSTTGANLGIQTGDFGTFVNSMYKLSIRIAGAVAVAMFIWGGITYMVAPLGISGEGIGEAKSRMQNAILGLLMLLATWIIFNQINPDILNLKIQAQPLKALQAPASSSTQTEAEKNYPAATRDESTGQLTVPNVVANPQIPTSNPNIFKMKNKQGNDFCFIKDSGVTTRCPN